jgi:hypothetical protein
MASMASMVAVSASRPLIVEHSGRTGWRGVGFGHGPHVHGDRPVRLDHCLPDLGKDDLSVRSNQVIMTIMNMGTDDFHVQESLLD